MDPVLNGTTRALPGATIQRERHLVTTSGFFEGARDHERRAVVLQVGFELLAGHLRRVALVRAGDGEAAALGVVRRQRVERELLGAVAARGQPLGALDRLVLHHLLAAHFDAALVVAVDRLQVARAGVALQENAQSLASLGQACRSPLMNARIGTRNEANRLSVLGCVSGRIHMITRVDRA